MLELLLTALPFSADDRVRLVGVKGQNVMRAKTFRGTAGSFVVVPSGFLAKEFNATFVTTTAVGVKDLVSGGDSNQKSFVVRKGGSWLSAIDWSALPATGSWTVASIQVRITVNRNDGAGAVVVFAGPIVPPGTGSQGGQVFKAEEISLPEGAVVTAIAEITGGAVTTQGIAVSASVTVAFQD